MDSELYTIGLYILFGGAAVIFPFLFFVTAPYGRHSRPGWGPVIPARLGWLVMELPSPLCFAWLYFSGDHWADPARLVLFTLFMAHYVYRSLIYPFRMRGSAKTKPFLTVMMAILFNVVNGSLNGWAIGHLGSHLDASWLGDPRFIIGIGLFILGACINLRSDAILRNLKRPPDGSYVVPQEGLHRQVASPNYFGEIIEWLGFAIAAWTLPAFGFLAFTIANLAPRARSHLNWYRQTFLDYPAERRALIPKVW